MNDLTDGVNMTRLPKIPIPVINRLSILAFSVFFSRETPSLATIFPYIINIPTE